VPHIREWVGGREVERVEGEGGWFNDATYTGNRVVCTMGQTDSQRSPDHTTSHADVQLDRIGP